MSVFDAVAFQRRDHEGVREGVLLVQPRGEREQREPFDEVDLVEDQDLRLLQSGSFSRIASASSSMPLRASISSADHIGVARSAPGGCHHRPVEPALGREDAGRVDEDDLRRALDGDAAYEGPRRLHLVRDDRDLGADERVEQGRLAGIGRADQRDEARLASPVCSGVAIVVLRPHAFPQEETSCCGLFGDTLRCADARLALRPLTLTMIAELGRMVRADLLDDAIGRRRQAAALRPFLQGALRIAQGRGAAHQLSAKARATRSRAAS